VATSSPTRLRANEAEVNRLSEHIIGCAFQVLNTAGARFLKKLYENALAHELRKKRRCHLQDGARLLFQQRTELEFGGEPLAGCDRNAGGTRDPCQFVDILGRGRLLEPQRIEFLHAPREKAIGGFRSKWSADLFANIRSVVDAYQAIADILRGGPVLQFQSGWADTIFVVSAVFV